MISVRVRTSVEPIGSVISILDALVEVRPSLGRFAPTGQNRMDEPGMIFVDCAFLRDRLLRF